ncbi:TetR/AcrR family transcriptional regulator [Streptomyces sp. Isolate_45]|uniref:TetR/AcrR family transcriptional regulator n=1 Tax=Streptomyces sp. Isolate_45 TaxID=2950111 RepID=UPI002481D86B|nr:TetR/AcrR family transcriptional regulator [Streptomyces sp. Isolate_45]MDA5284105.1 TetR/AcrR family transcriptional regulator [Streptomyces sp. Isolate_45]
MGRTADQAKRDHLLRQVRAYVTDKGLADLSLRPLAKALGTSDRMLLYYFGSKEQLVARALDQDEGRPLLVLRRALEVAGAPTDPAAMRTMLDEAWRQFTTPPERRDILPVTFEVLTASVLDRERYGPLMRDLLTEWRRVLAGAFTGLGMSDGRAWCEATLLVDTLLGLLYTPLADGDWDRATATFRILLDRLEPAWHTRD